MVCGWSYRGSTPRRRTTERDTLEVWITAPRPIRKEPIMTDTIIGKVTSAGGAVTWIYRTHNGVNFAFNTRANGYDLKTPDRPYGTSNNDLLADFQRHAQRGHVVSPVEVGEISYL